MRDGREKGKKGGEEEERATHSIKNQTDVKRRSKRGKKDHACKERVTAEGRLATPDTK